MKIIKTVFFSLILLLLFYQSASAGTKYYMVCSNCNFQLAIHFGPTRMAAPSVPFYCTKCASIHHFVSFYANVNGTSYVHNYNNNSTSENKIFKPTEPIGEIWNFENNKMIKLYKCPVCNSICNEITSVEELKFCPKCKKNTLVNKRIGKT